MPERLQLGFETSRTFVFWKQKPKYHYPMLLNLHLNMQKNKYGLLTKCEVKMAGYWPTSLFASLWTETESRSINSQKKNEDNFQPS